MISVFFSSLKASLPGVQETNLLYEYGTVRVKTIFFLSSEQSSKWWLQINMILDEMITRGEVLELNLDKIVNGVQAKRK